MPDQNNPIINPPNLGGTPVSSPFDAFPTDTPSMPGAPSANPPSNPPAGSSSGPTPPDIVPPIVTSPPPKKGVSGRVIATILGILVLVGGVGAGIVLVQQQQLFKQKAAEGLPNCDTVTVDQGKNCVSKDPTTFYETTCNQSGVGTLWCHRDINIQVACTYCSAAETTQGLCMSSGSPPACEPNLNPCVDGQQCSTGGGTGGGTPAGACSAGETCRSGGAPGPNGKYGCAGWDETSTGKSCSTVAQGTCCVKGTTAGTCNAGETCRSGGAPGPNGQYGCAGWGETSTGKSCSTVAQGTCCVKPGGGGATPTPAPGGGTPQKDCTFDCQSGDSKKECIPNSVCPAGQLACRDTGCGGGGTGGGAPGPSPAPNCTINPRIQISSDNGLNWTDISGTTITVPAGSTKVKIRGINAATGKIDRKVTARMVWRNDTFKGAVCANSECEVPIPGSDGFPTRFEAFENEIGGSDSSCQTQDCQVQSYYNEVNCVNRGGVNLGTGAPAQCLNIQAFDTDWVKITDLSTLKAGDKVRFTVAGQTSTGTFDRARFIINGATRPEVTGKRPTTQEFFDEYTIPTGTTTFSVNAQLHHSTLGWF